MKYFEAHAKDSYQDDLDISVHCDVAIFEWLMRYIKNKSEPQLSKPVDPSRQECHLHPDILQLLEDGQPRNRLHQVRGSPSPGHRQAPNRLELLDPKDRQADHCSHICKFVHSQVSDLDELNDKRDKLKSKLFTEKLRLLMRDEARSL